MFTPVFFFARVEDIEDPLKLGRVKVRCYGDHSLDVNALPVASLLWAHVLHNTSSAGLHGIGTQPHLAVGSDVFGFYADGLERQVPVIIGVLGSSAFQNFIETSQTLLPFTQTGLQQSNITPQGPQLGSTNAPNYTLTPTDITSAQVGVCEIGTVPPNIVANLKAALGYVESHNTYNITNQIGYIGKYQFGYSALQTVGFVNNNATSNKQLTQMPNNVWVGKMNINSSTDWFNSPPAQEYAMDALLQVNFKTLTQLAVISPDTPVDVVCGYLAVSHLLGPGGARDLKNGIVGTDGNGTTATKYYNLGVSVATKGNT